MPNFCIFPRIFYIEPTNDCNLQCLICPRKKISRPVGYMDFRVYKNIIDQLVDQEVASLSLHQLGEPLLHPQICQMVEYAKGKGIKFVRFSTNGILLKQNLASGLIAAGLDSLTLSMDSLSGPKYSPAEISRGLFKVIDENILRFLKIRNTRLPKRPFIEMQIVRFGATEKLISPFIKKWEKLADATNIKECLSWGGQIKGPSKKAQKQLICANFLNQGVIRWNGDATFCCLYAEEKKKSEGILGNALKDSLEDIFLGEKRRTLINEQLKGDYSQTPYCWKCADWIDYPVSLL